jgi:hypothetical protein
MKRFLISTATHLVGNGIGLLLAAILLDGFSIAPMAFLIVTVIFTAVEVVASPLITRLSQNNLPALKGGVALVTTFVGLWITSLFVQGMTLGGLANWLGATLLVWLGALIVVIVLPIFVFKSLREDRKG